MSVFSNLYENKIKEIQTQNTRENNLTYIFISTLYKSTVIHSFEWSPETLPEMLRVCPDLLEEFLYRSGQIAYFRADGKDMVAPCFGSGKLLPNGLYDMYTMIFPDGTQYILPLEDIEICFNNYDSIPSEILVREMVSKSTRALRAVDLTLERSMLPYLALCKDENTTNMVTNALKDAREQKEAVAVVTGDYTSNDIETKAMYDDKMENVMSKWDIFIRYRNLFFTAFGINTVEISKAERLTKAEGTSNDEIVQFTLFGDMYKHRLEWIERVKKHFGVELKMEVNRGVSTTAMLNTDTEEKMELNEMIIAPYKDVIREKEGIETEGGEENAERD